MILYRFLAFVGLFSFLKADQSCKGSCTTDGYPLPCGVWLKNETKLAVLGTYELGKGVARLFCSFSSLPEPVQIQWMFRPSEGSTQWREFTCAKKEERKNCQKEEIIVESSCEVRTNSLTNSGTYRCSATIPNHSEHRYRAFSSEFPINVVGIETPTVISSHLPLNHHGHIDLEICANPRPEIFWHTTEGIIEPQGSTHRFASTSLSQRKILRAQNDPVLTIPYCYQSSILIHKVHQNDQFRLTIRGELSTVNEKISVRVKTSSFNSYLLTLISVLFYILQ